MKEQIKKVVIAALVAAVSIAARADTFTWSIRNVGNSCDGNKFNASSGYGAYKAYLFASSDSNNKLTTTSISEVLGALKSDSEKTTSGTFEKLSVASATSLGNGKDTYVRFTDSNTSAKGVTSSSSSVIAGAEISFFAIVLDATSVTSAKTYMIATEETSGNQILTKTIDTSKENLFAWGEQFTNDGKTAKNGASWQTIASIPEPTSGLLLVLGAATLALKRRRV